MIRKGILAEVFFLFLFAKVAIGGTYYIAPTGSDGNSGTAAAPFRNIQKAANIVSPGDTVIVKDGTYTDTDSDDYVVGIARSGSSGNYITFRSENKWGAVIDGNSNAAGYGVVFLSGASYIKIEDFDIRGCGDSGVHGNSANQYIYITGNKIHDIGRKTTTTVYGLDGIYMGGGSDNWVIDSNWIYTIGRYNTTDGYDTSTCDPNCWNHDHGIYITNQYVDIINNVFFDFDAGWAIHIYTSVDPNRCNYINIVNNTFVGANPYRNGHIILATSMHDILIQNNISYSPTNAFINCGSCTGISDVIINNNLTNVAKLFSGVDPATCGSGGSNSGNQTSTNPLLSNSSENPALADYSLQANSPAIDAGLATGAPNQDIAKVIRPQGTGFDIGAYEYISDISDITPPTIPAGLTAVAISSSQINISWNPSTDDVSVEGYKIYRNKSYLTTTTNTSYEDVGLQPSTTYNYTVSAFDRVGNESPSQASSVSVTTQASETPFLSTSLANSNTMVANSGNFASDHPVEHLWDGCTDGTLVECNTGAGNISSFWVEFNFGQNYDLTLARLFGDALGTWVSSSWQLQYKLKTEDSWTTAFSNVNALFNDWSTQEMNNIRARYVRVEVFGHPDLSGTQARELEIYGSASISPQSPSAPHALRIVDP